MQTSEYTAGTTVIYQLHSEFHRKIIWLMLNNFFISYANDEYLEQRAFKKDREIQTWSK